MMIHVYKRWNLVVVLKKGVQEGRMGRCKMKWEKEEVRRRGGGVRVEEGKGWWGEERGSMNNPLENHDRIKTRWEPKISPAKAARCNNAATKHNMTAATPAASLLQLRKWNVRGIIKSHCDVAAYCKTSLSIFPTAYIQDVYVLINTIKVWRKKINWTWIAVF